MPRINRLRIINFSYNNEHRHILDETFNLHGGDNALLNLANGGGKSVLVQLLLQPVAPEVKIQGRSITGFFRRKKLPAYILIEWKLDGGGGYLLSGIGIVAAEASGAEEDKSRIKYFTFTSKYTSANAFDLAHIDLVRPNGNILEIKPFQEARELLAEKAKKDPYTFGYFPDEDGDKYKKRLAEYGIAQDEWKNIIAKINDHEGGLEEIFLKYKNSSQLLDEWIIKTIEKVKFKDRSQARQLEEMLESLVREVSENERFIVEKQLLEQFLGEFGGQLDVLSDLLAGLEAAKKIAGKMAAMHRFLYGETLALEERQEGNRQELAGCAQEKQLIQLEERSYTYWRRQGEYQEAAERLAAAAQNRRETEEELAESKRAAKIMQAAGLREEIRLKRAELSGVEERLAAARSGYDTDERRRSLEFSLQKLCAQALQTLAEELERRRAEESEQKKQLGQVKSEAARLDQDLGNLREERGRLQAQKDNHESYAGEVAARLQISLNRNLLGELAGAELEKIGLRLAKERDNWRAQGEKLAAERAAAEKREQELDRVEKEGQEARSLARDALNGILREIAAYEKQEEEVKGILQKYGFPAELRFERERLTLSFARLLQNLEQQLEEIGRLREELRESLLALRNGRLHIPEELATLLGNLDIPYDTGETYLRNQPPEIRREILAGNPVLPYALILARENISRLAQAVENLTMRRVIPLIAYEDLSLTLAPAGGGRVVRTREGVGLVCLYEGRVFDNESLAQLEAELQQKKGEAGEQHAHYAGERQEAAVKQDICLRFAYPPAHRYALGQQQTSAEARLEETGQKLSQCDAEKDDLRRLRLELEQKQAENQKLQERAAAAAGLFAEFLKREEKYQECLKRWAQVTQEIGDLEVRKGELAARREAHNNRINELTQDIRQKERESREFQEKSSLYQNAPEAPIIPGDLAELEKRLKALQAAYSGEISVLEDRQTELRREGDKKEKDLRKLGLAETEYAGVRYDEEKLDLLNAEITTLEALGKERQEKEVEAARAESGAERARAIALEEVRKLGAEYPLAQEEIRGNFPERRRKVQARENELQEDNRQLARQANEYGKLNAKIGEMLPAAETEPARDFRPEPDLPAQAEKLTRSFRETGTGNGKLAAQLRNKYNGIKADYQDKNPNIGNIFKGLDQLWEQAGLEYDHYFYLYERLAQHQEKLRELIKLHESQLANLERDKKDLIQQSLLQGLEFYEEILWISDNSKVRLQGRSRPVHMLKIELEMDSLEAAAERMREYIEEGIQKVRQETRLEKREDEVKKTVSKLMSSRELLNICLGNARIPVKVFKIDLNMQNSGLKTWEDAVHENSGGEKFVVFFSLLSALMSYTRTRTLEALGAEGDSETDTSVLLMDNPFGPISSEHLLNPLFEIAKKHRTQLICLSDLKQNSIMNCFNLIYMLKVRTSAIGNNEYLKFEEIVRDPGALEDDEKLEKAVFRVSESKQISLFD